MEKQTGQSDNYKIVPYHNGLIDDFYALYQSVHKQLLAKEHFLTKGNTSFTGQPIIGFIAYERLTNQVAAFYGVYPVLVNLNGQWVLAAQSGDTLTHGNHRRRGLWEKLVELTKDECKNRAIQFIFGFPNSSSTPGFKKFGWPFYPNKKNFYFRRERNFIEKIKNRIFPDMAFKLLNHKFVGSEKISSLGFQSDVMRTDSYFSYKNKLSGARFYQINSCVIWAKVEPNTIVIGDVQANDNTSMAAIAKELAQLPSILNLCNLYFSLSHFNPLIAELQKIPGMSVSESEFVVWPLSNLSGFENFRYSSVDDDTF